MNPWPGKQWLGFAIGFAALGGSCDDGPAASSASEPNHPHVLLITVDTLRKDELGCYGYARQTSPHIDALAAESTIYHRAYSQAPWTTPSLGSLLTSKYPAQIGIVDELSILDDDLVLLSESLQEAGYATGAVVSHSFCSARWNFDQGFDSFDESNVKGYLDATAADVTDRGLEFLETREDSPFFLWLHYFDPHGAYREHDEFRFEDAQGNGPYDQAITLEDLRSHPLNPRNTEIVRRFYDSEIAYTDHHIGRFLDQLRETGLSDQTLIVFTSDHGEAFGDHNLFGHSASLYDELVNVPLIVKYPAESPASSDRLVALLDVYPTVLEQLGLPPRDDLEGRSLRSEPSAELRSIFIESFRYVSLRGVVNDQFKLIKNLDGGTIEFFDLTVDPAESRNLTQVKPPGFRKTRRSLNQWEKALEGRPEGERLELSESDRERLKALGYLEHEPPPPGKGAGKQD